MCCMSPVRRGASLPIFNRIAVLRAERKMTRAQLAELIEVNPQTVGALERGDHYPASTSRCGSARSSISRGGGLLPDRVRADQRRVVPSRPITRRRRPWLTPLARAVPGFPHPAVPEERGAVQALATGLANPGETAHPRRHPGGDSGMHARRRRGLPDEHARRPAVVAARLPRLHGGLDDAADRLGAPGRCASPCARRMGGPAARQRPPIGLTSPRSSPSSRRCS